VGISLILIPTDVYVTRSKDMYRVYTKVLSMRSFTNRKDAERFIHAMLSFIEDNKIIMMEEVEEFPGFKLTFWTKGLYISDTLGFLNSSEYHT
jgi:hypothetical protein